MAPTHPRSPQYPWCPYTPSGPSVPRVTASTKWSLLKFTPQVSYFQFEGKLEFKFTPHVEFKFSDDTCRSAARYNPPQLKLSVTAGQLLVDQCLKWEPIWNSHIHNSFTLCPVLHVVIWCLATGQVSHAFMTSENAAISVNFKLFLLFFWSVYDFILLLLCSIHNYTWTTTNRITTRMRIKRFM